MKICELLLAGEVKGRRSITKNISNISIDSRNVNKDSLFVCLVGSFTDGHKYAFDAYRSGCRHFVAERDLHLPEDAKVFIAKNTRALLAKISCRFYGNPSEKLKVIGITGTKGKTTTALMVAGLMNSAGKNCGYIGSNGVYFNNTKYKTENTTPESILLQRTLADMADSGVRYVALEVSSQALYTYRVDGVRFDTVVYTNLARDHIGKFEHPDMEHYIECKSRLFKNDTGADLCVYNADDNMAERITGEFKGKRISYSVNGMGHVNAENLKYYEASNEIGSAFDIVFDGNRLEAILPMAGDFNVVNSLCAFTVCKKYDIQPHVLAENISNLRVDGRFEMFHTDKGVTFVIDYAHNGLSLACALDELRKFCKGKLICLFGSVGDRTVERREELGSAAARYSDYCIITSDNPGFEDPESILTDIAIHVRKGGCPYKKIVDREEAIRYAYEMSEKGDIVLLAGKGHETYQLVKNIKEPFSERMILEKIKMQEKKAYKV